MSSGGDEPGVDRLAIAEKVIRSAGEILLAAGFDRSEIAAFLRQAADQIDSAPSRPPSPPATAPAERLQAALGTVPAVRSLAGLVERAETLMNTPGSLAPRFDVAMQMIPLLAEVQEALRRTTQEAGFQFLADRRQADESGIAAAADALYFEDLGHPCVTALEHLCSLAEALAGDGDEQAFAFLLQSLSDNGVTVTGAFADAMQRAVAAFAR